MIGLPLVLLFYVHQGAECSTFRNESIPESGTSNGIMIGCEEGWYSFNHKCYKVGGSKNVGNLSWEKASDYCRDDGGNLVVIENQETQDFVLVLLLELEHTMWIGLDDRLKESEYTWVDGSAFNYTNWKPREPSGLRNEIEDCIQMLFLPDDENLGKWNDASCDQAFPFVCQKDQIENSTAMTVLDPIFCSERNKSGIKFRNSCYNLVKEKKNWKDAEAYCKHEYSGHLIEIRTFSVDVFLDYALKDFNRDIWIGVSIKDTFPQKWSNGFMVRYNGWEKSEGNFYEGFCSTRSGSRRWNNAACGRKFPFICEQASDEQTVQIQATKDYVCPSEPDDWIDLGGDMCYFFEAQKMVSWYEANFMCMFRGGHLASFHSKEESEAMHGIIFNYGYALYIGLHRLVEGGDNFIWSDGSAMDYINWDLNEPNGAHEKCAEIRTVNTKWNDIGCNDGRGYVCSIRKIPRNWLIKTNLTVLEGLSQEPACISVEAFTAVLACTFFVLVLLAVMLAYYFKPWIRKEYRRNVAGFPIECSEIPDQ